MNEEKDTLYQSTDLWNALDKLKRAVIKKEDFNSVDVLNAAETVELEFRNCENEKAKFNSWPRLEKRHQQIQKMIEMKNDEHLRQAMQIILFLKNSLPDTLKKDIELLKLLYRITAARISEPINFEELYNSSTEIYETIHNNDAKQKLNFIVDIRNKLISESRQLQKLLKHYSGVDKFIGTYSNILYALICLNSGIEPNDLRGVKAQFLDYFDLYDCLRFRIAPENRSEVKQALEKAKVLADKLLHLLETNEHDYDENYLGFLKTRIAAIYQAYHQNGQAKTSEKNEYLQKALDIWNKHIEDYGGNMPEAHLDFNGIRIAYCYKFQNRLDEAISWYDKVIASENTKKRTVWEAYIRKAECLSMQGLNACKDYDDDQAVEKSNAKWLEAEECIRAAHAMDMKSEGSNENLLSSKNQTLIHKLVNLYWFSGQLNKAKDAQIRLVEMQASNSPWLGITYLQLGHTYAELKENENALRAYECAFDIDRSYSKHLQLFRLIMQNEKILEIVVDGESRLPPPKFLEITIHDNIEHRIKLSRQINDLLKRGQSHQVIKTLELLFEEARIWGNKNVENDPFFLTLFAKAHHMLGNSEEALQYLEKAYDVDKSEKNISLVLHLKGNVYAALGDYEKSIISYNQSLYYGNRPDTMTDKAYCLRAKGDIQKAIYVLQDLLESGLDNRAINTYTLLAQLHLEQWEKSGYMSAKELYTANYYTQLACEKSEFNLHTLTFINLAPILRQHNDEAQEILIEILNHIRNSRQINTLMSLFVPGKAFPKAIFGKVSTRLWEIGTDFTSTKENLQELHSWIKLAAVIIVTDYFLDKKRYESNLTILATILKKLEATFYNKSFNPLMEFILSLRAPVLKVVIGRYIEEAKPVLNPLLDSDEEVMTYLRKGDFLDKTNKFIAKNLNEELKPNAYGEIPHIQLYAVLNEYIKTELSLHFKALGFGDLFPSAEIDIEGLQNNYVSQLQWKELKKNIGDFIYQITTHDPVLLTATGPSRIKFSIFQNHIHISVFPGTNDVVSLPQFEISNNNALSLINKGFQLTIPILQANEKAISLYKIRPFLEFMLREEEDILTTGKLKETFYKDAFYIWNSSAFSMDDLTTDIAPAFLSLITYILDSHHEVVISWLQRKDRTKGVVSPRALLHDFAKPAIRNALLDLDTDPDSYRTRLKKVQREIELFLATLHDVVRPGILELQTQFIDFGATVRNMIEKIMTTAKVEIFCPLGLYASVDQFALRRVLTNLLDNARSAVEGTEHPSIKVRIQQTRIKDTEQIDLHISNNYNHIDGHKHGGTGTGQETVTRLVENALHGSVKFSQDYDNNKYDVKVTIPLLSTNN